MKSTLTFTEKHKEALELINQSTANIWSHPKGARGGKDSLDNICEYCGKHSNDEDGNYFQILTSGLIIPNKIDEATIWDLHHAGIIKDQPQGGFKIGSTCANKLLGSKLKSYL